jgi:hypothetical protein
MSPSADILRNRCRSFPGLVKNTSIDWLFPWPPQALAAVASVFLAKVITLYQETSNYNVYLENAAPSSTYHAIKTCRKGRSKDRPLRGMEVRTQLVKLRSLYRWEKKPQDPVGISLIVFKNRSFSGPEEIIPAPAQVRTHIFHPVGSSFIS